MNTEKLITSWQILPWQRVRQVANKVLPKLFLIIVLLLLAQTFAELTWSLFDYKQTQVVITNPKSSVAALNSKAPSVNLHQVVQYHLFGDAEKKSSAVQAKIIDAPDTRLQLVLKGVFASTNPKMALAIIANNKGNDKTYHIGDKISGGAILHAVYADRVILKRKGQLETLRLPKTITESLYSENAGSDITANKSLNRAQAGNKKKLRTLRQSILKDPGKMWEQVRINPVMKNGKVRGYTLLHNDPALMTSLGIRKTDVILAVNGESLSDPATLYGLVKTLSQAQQLAITIERNGKQRSIQLSF